MSERIRRFASSMPRWARFAPLPFVLWPLFVLVNGERRWEFTVVMVLVPALAVIGSGTRRLLLAIYPLALVGVLYDAMRFVQYAGIRASDVHVCDLRALEIQLVKNPFDRDCIAKKEAGFPDEHFLRGHDVFLGDAREKGAGR